MDASDAHSSDSQSDQPSNSRPAGRARSPQQPSSQPAASAAQSTGKAIKTLTLMKGNEQFCFRYEVGEESGVLDAMVDMVNRREFAFDWFDAAVLSHQLGQLLAKELKTLLPKKAA